MSEIWLTTDTHLGHDKVARLRGFDSVAAHDDAICAGIVEKVRPGDDLWLMGDVVFGREKQAGLERLASLVEGARIHVVLGNHDRPHPLERNAHDHVRLWWELFDTVQTTARLRHDGVTYLLSHFPYDASAGETFIDDAGDEQYRLRDLGRPLIHGHVHDRFRFRRSQLGTPMFHAGLDAWDLKPVSLPTLVAAGE